MTDIPSPQSAALGLYPVVRKLLLINRPRRDGTLSWHRYTAATGGIRTHDLAIASPASLSHRIRVYLWAALFSTRSLVVCKIWQLSEICIAAVHTDTMNKARTSVATDCSLTKVVVACSTNTGSVLLKTDIWWNGYSKHLNRLTGSDDVCVQRIWYQPTSVPSYSCSVSVSWPIFGIR